MNILVVYVKINDKRYFDITDKHLYSGYRILYNKKNTHTFISEASRGAGAQSVTGCGFNFHSRR